MTPIDQITSTLDAIQARADAATKGPFECFPANRADTVRHIGPKHDPRWSRVQLPTNDAVFHCSARTDIPNLVAALRVAVENLEILSGWSQEADVCGCYKRSVDALSAIAEKLNLTKQ